LSLTVTTAQLARSSSIFFVAAKTESVGETVTTLEMPVSAELSWYNNHNMQAN